MLALFDNKELMSQLKKSLPIAFSIARETSEGNPAVGFLREHILVGYFQKCFAVDKVNTPSSSVSVDIML